MRSSTRRGSMASTSARPTSARAWATQERVDLKHPDLVAVLDKILDGCKRRGLAAGIHVASTDYARSVIEKGFQFVTILSDGRLLASAAKQAVDAVRGTDKRPVRPAGPY